MENSEETKLQTFLQWLQANKVELRGCKIKYCGINKGFGLFYDTNTDVNKSNGILVVVPLDLAITPMRVLEDPYLGPKCRAMFEEGEVDDRFLMNLFLTVERLRKNSAWKPYLDLLPTTFGNPLWFTDDELLELKGTTLYRATELQKKTLQSLYEAKVKDLVVDLLDGKSESEVNFKDFLWANSIFWTRALNIPFPRSYIFSQTQQEQENCPSLVKDSDASPTSNGVEDKTEGTLNSTQGESIWVEGLVPGIDFCNHDLKAAATWEVDGSGLTTGIPASMYLLSAEQSPYTIEKEVCISYGNKGNEELLYLYGFAIDNNPDDYLMVHYPIEAFQSVPFADTKGQLLEIQKAEMRCLLPRTLLDQGFFSPIPRQGEDSIVSQGDRMCNYSWSGQRKLPSYSNRLVFPEDFLTALRTIAMKEEELNKVSSLLEELIGSGEEREPSNAEVRAAIWEACGDSGALQLLVDLLQMKMMELEEGSGTEACDTSLLEKALIIDIPEGSIRDTEVEGVNKMSRHRWSSIIYRRGQKQLTRLFLMEAEHALQLCLSEEG
ncbi:hypothetical protein AQUCO_01300446v1 [Aquilegia coerulea]|uniref:Uncharacterized protein n=1 Tax=Aquilegia coerulea TaxID=218851 RepID=A0A2G5E2B8_AQUCA|nr:hypothetical protein AQUCO_01300446v1 [Aquilegia coerulea]